MPIPNDWTKNKKYKKQKSEKTPLQILEDKNKLTQDDKERLRTARLNANHYRDEKKYIKVENEILNKYWFYLNKGKLFIFIVNLLVGLCGLALFYVFVK